MALTDRGALDGRPRIRYWVAGAVCLVAIGFLLFGALFKNVVYFRTPSEAIERRASEGTRRFRLAGNVVDGSVRELRDGVAFSVTDGKTTIQVHHVGDPPQLFKEGAPVVCEGRWNGALFASDRIMIKHGAEYRPPVITTTTSVATAPAPTRAAALGSTPSTAPLAAAVPGR